MVTLKKSFAVWKIKLHASDEEVEAIGQQAHGLHLVEHQIDDQFWPLPYRLPSYGHIHFRSIKSNIRIAVQLTGHSVISIVCEHNLLLKRVCVSGLCLKLKVNARKWGWILKWPEFIELKKLMRLDQVSWRQDVRFQSRGHLASLFVS